MHNHLHDPIQSALDQIASAMPPIPDFPPGMPHLGNPDLLTPGMQADMLSRADERNENKRLITSEPINDLVARANSATPLAGHGGDMPLLQIVGDPAVEREFLAILNKQGRVQDDPGNPGGYILTGSTVELSQVYTQAAEQVALREGRQVVAAVLQTDSGRGSWPGGAIFGAAENHQELHKQAARELVHGYPSDSIAKTLDRVARDPGMLISDEGLRKAELRELLTKFTDPQNAAPSRSISISEAANLAANVETLAKTLGQDDPVSRKAMQRVGFFEDQMRQGYGDKYDQVKAVIQADLGKAQLRSLEGRGVEVEMPGHGRSQSGTANGGSAKAGTARDTHTMDRG